MIKRRTNTATSTRALAAVCLATALGLLLARPAEGVGRTCADDFEQFWRRSLADRLPLPPGALDAARPGQVTFPVTETMTAGAYFDPGAGAADAIPIIYLHEGGRPTLPAALSQSRAWLCLPWRDGDEPLAEWYLSGLPDPRACSLRRAILTACQAVDLLFTHPSLRATRVGLIGDGYGAAVALAVAALMPERTAFVIAHQPRPAYHRLADGTVTSCSEVRRILRTLSADREHGEAAFAALTYFDAINFAPLLRAPALFIAGGRDREAPLDEIRQLYALLRCDCDSVLDERLGHSPSVSLPGFPELFARWLARVEAWRAPLTSE
jgi:pimeloyl-ACP methyl ester carboxylesterase